MDVSPTALVNAAVQMKQTQAAQEVQLTVMKKAMDLQESAALMLLQAMPGQLPLADSGHLGTQVNQLV